MCGLAGVFFETADRSPEELRHLTGLFARLLAISELRGDHASGVAILRRKGKPRILKAPIAASRFVRRKDFERAISRVGPETTLLMGHARWTTRGDPADNRNNHPILAGRIVGTHNGTITNADELFSRLDLPREADVDSEILFRLADQARLGRAIDETALLGGLALCRGQMSAAIASVLDPGRLLLFRGNRPLQARYDPRRRALIYASEALFLDAVLAGEPGWRGVPLPPMHYLDVQAEDPGDAALRPFWFDAEGEGAVRRANRLLPASRAGSAQAVSIPDPKDSPWISAVSSEFADGTRRGPKPIEGGISK
jgi:glutamine phosphoribosylpyrophosphate amidotransferase